MKAAFNTWQPSHILSRHNELIDWMFLRKNGYTVATISKDDRLIAFFAYVLPNIQDQNQLALINGAGWWASNDAPGAGMAVLRFALGNLPGEFVALGLSETSKALYRREKFQLSRLRNYHLVASNTADAWGCSNIRTYPCAGALVSANEVLNSSASRQQLRALWTKYPSRSAEFMSWRYETHPVLDYQQQVHFFEGRMTFWATYRVIQTDRGAILRLIDLLIWPDTSSSNVANGLSLLLFQSGCTAIDYRYSGFDSGLLREIFCEEGCPAELPHRVSPIDWRSTIVDTVSSSPIAHLTRGDGDQDRPN